MSGLEQSQPIPGHEGIKEGETVYYLFDRHVGTLGIGQLVEPTSGVDYVVLIGNHGQTNPRHGLEVRVRGWNIFRHAEVVEIAEDILPKDNQGETDVSFEALRALIRDPENAREMAIRLTPEATEKNLNTKHTMRSFGYRTVGQIVGHPEDRYSNVARLQKTLTDAREGRIPEGSNNFVDLPLFEPADALVDINILRNTRIRIAAANRQALDKIYEIFGADFERPAVLEREMDNGDIDRRKIRRLFGDRAFFIESSLHQRSEMGYAQDPPYAIDSTLFIGEPDVDRMLEQNYVQVSDDDH